MNIIFSRSLSTKPSGPEEHHEGNLTKIENIPMLILPAFEIQLTCRIYDFFGLA